MSEGSEFPDWLKRIIETMAEKPEITGLAASITAIAIGSALLIDDVDDFGKTGAERNPPIPHHWIWGAITLIGGVIGSCAAGTKMLMEIGEKLKLSKSDG